MMDSTSKLRVYLDRLIGNGLLKHDEQRLFNELEVQKLRLLRLFDVGARNSQEQREIESGRTVIDGKHVAVNADFARQSIFLSQQLNCSERYVAELLYGVTTENPNIDPVHCLEAVVAEFHQRRRDLVDCVEGLVKAVQAAAASDPSDIILHVAEFVEQSLINWTERGDDSWALRIFRQIEGFDAVFTNVESAINNAGSTTTMGSQQGAPRENTLRSGPLNQILGGSALGQTVLMSRYESLKYERRKLANAFVTISRIGFCSPNEIKLTVDWLARSPNHAMTYHLLTAALNAFETANPQSLEWSRREQTITNRVLTDHMIRTLAPSSSQEWRDPALKAVILLKWTLSQTEARNRNPELERRDGFRTEELQTQIWNAVQGDAFSYLALAVVQLRRQYGSVPSTSLLNTLSLTVDQQDHRTPPAEDFRPSVLAAFESLIRMLITHASSELRKIKQRQEDLASARSDRSRVTSRFAASLATPDSSVPPPRSDIATLYSFIGLLYSSLPSERAIQFWGSGPQPEALQASYLEYTESTSGRLPAFLQWAVWSTPANDVALSTALYEMLGGLAKGQQCSELAYNFMARGSGEVIPGSVLPTQSTGNSVSWTAIFSILESWASSPNNRPQQQQAHLGFSTFGNGFSHATASRPPPSQQIIIGPKEVLFAQSFLQLLSTVASHSLTVRIAISGNVHLRAIPTLVSLVPMGIPLELKGALFETLSAFCEPGAGSPGVDICKAVWTLMERLEVINVRATPMGPFGAALPVKGIEAELEEIEAVHRSYPSTIPFLKLLSTLIHTTKRSPPKDRYTDMQLAHTYPETLGQPYRLPGIGPFTSFVIDNVFANIPNREYSRPSDRWQMNDLSLCFIERALASFSLESLVNNPDANHLKGDQLAHLLVHPGYDVMKRMLTRNLLQTSILSYTVEGVKGFEKNIADDEPFFATTIIRVLRIIHRVLEIQDIFLDVLIPLLSEIDSTSLAGPSHPRSFYTKFDQELTYGSQYIPALAAYITFPSYPELALLSIKILSLLSTSNPSYNLATVIDRSNESERILFGFMSIMNVEPSGDVVDTETLMEETTGAGAPDSDNAPQLAHAVRLVALDLLIQETQAHRHYPNIGHFLLFGNNTDAQQIQDPHALGAHRTSIHVLLDLVNIGIPRIKGKEKETVQNQSEPLFVSLPGIAEKCYRIVYQLCTHPKTSDFTTRYLRTREDFFARQLASVPSHAPQLPAQPYIQLQYNDGARTLTTVSSLSAFLRLRSCIFDLVALEIHILTNKGHLKGVSELLNILFGNTLDNESEEEAFYDFRDIGQSNLRIIEFLQSLMFEWSDSLTIEPLELQFLRQLNLQSCVRTDAAGCEVIDQVTLLSLLNFTMRTLHAQGSVITPNQADQLQRETAYILESCVVENHRREVLHSVAQGFESWRRLLDLTLTKCFDRLPHDRRENMLFDLLHVLPTAIQNPDIQESTAVLLSEAILSSITKLREDRQQQLIAQSAGGNAEAGSLPAERLYSILRSILEDIIENNRVELVRGNLYAALINYVHLIAFGGRDTFAMAREDRSGLSLSLSAVRGDSALDRSHSVVPIDRSRSANPSQSLYTGSLAVMKDIMERLVSTIARDAIDGTEVWKTVAFMLLNALMQLAGAEKRSVVLTALTRHGILSNFIRGLKESDSTLLSILKPDPDDLNTLYVYEAKMTLFIRMSQTRAGAERLLEGQIVPVLAQCDFLDARPEADQSFMDQDSFLPSAIQRYHQLLMPALQLVDGMLTTLGYKHTTIVNQALDLLTSHSATITILLKNDAEYAPLALLEEIHLIVTLCAGVLPSVPKSEMLVTNSGFGAIHAAILNLATRCLGTGRFFSHIVPQTDAEMQWANEHAFGYESQSRFDVRVQHRERLVQKSIISYIGSASDFTEPEITVVLSPITSSPRQEQVMSHFLSTIPTIGDALEALGTLCASLAHTLKQISDLSAELAARDHIVVDNISEVIRDGHTSLLQDLDIDQKRQLICEELENVKRGATRQARVLLDTTEMLLLLIWRHIQYYSSPTASLPTPITSLSSSTLSSVTKPQKALGMNATMRFLAAPDPETFKSDVGRRLGAALGKLEALNSQLDSEAHGQSHGYIEIMARRLRDSTGLLQEDSGINESDIS